MSKTENEVKFFTSSLLVQSFSWQNEESDHRRKDVLIFRQLLFTSSIWNVWRKLTRICIMISALKGPRLKLFGILLVTYISWTRIIDIYLRTEVWQKTILHSLRFHAQQNRIIPLKKCIFFTINRLNRRGFVKAKASK